MGQVFITGAAGFIGSNLTDALLAAGHAVTGYDNFTTGKKHFLASALAHPSFTLVKGDILDAAGLRQAMQGCDAVVHLAANADVRFGLEDPRRDLTQNTVGTFEVLEAARLTGVKRFVFSSTGSVYGEAVQIPTPEDAAFPSQTSLYGAAKLAGESLIQAYAEGYGMQATIFRFVSILGPRYTHGHVYDFYRKLKQDPKKLEVLGNGKQRKSYLHVADCVAAVMQTINVETPKATVYNLGVDGFCEVLDSVGWICDELGLKPEACCQGGERGWVGDNPFIYLETKKIRATGWAPRHSIEASVRDTVRWLRQNEWVFEGA